MRASGVALVLMGYGAMNVGPEFLDDDRHGVEADLRAPHFGSVLQGSVRGNKQVGIRRRADVGAPRVIAVGGDGSAQGAAENL